MIVAGKSFNAVLQDILKSIIDMLMKQALFGKRRDRPARRRTLGLIADCRRTISRAPEGRRQLGDAGGGSIGDILGGASPSSPHRAQRFPPGRP